MKKIFSILLISVLVLSFFVTVGVIKISAATYSLADFAKPTLVYDQKGTNRSKYSGPLIYPAFRWATSSKIGPSNIWATYLFGDQLIGGTQGSGIGGKLFSINRNTGVEAWNRDFQWYGANSITQDGTFYNCEMNNDTCSAINLNTGSLKWSYPFYSGHGNNQTLIGNDGTVYTTRQQNLVTLPSGCMTKKNTGLYAINPDGTIKWHTDIAVSTDYIHDGRLSLNNNILYMGYSTETDCLAYSNKGKLLALSAVNGSQLWEYNTGDLSTNVEPVIDDNGIIYVGNHGYNLTNLKKLYAINPDGTLKWEKSFGITAEFGFEKMALRNDGILLAAWTHRSSAQYTQTYTIYAIRISDGITLWSRRIDNFYGDILADGSGGYFGLVYDAGNNYSVNYYDTNNVIKWKFSYTNIDPATRYQFGGLSQDERGWLYTGFTRRNSADANNNYIKFAGLVPWTLTPSLGSTGTYQPGNTLNLSVISSMLPSNPLQTGINAVNKVQVIMEDGTKIPLVYSSVNSSGNTVWSATYTLPSTITAGSHSYIVEASAADIQTDIVTHFTAPATGSLNTGLTATGTFIVSLPLSIPTPTLALTSSPGPTYTPTPVPSGNKISLNPAVTYQTMTGWEATDYIGGENAPGLSAYKNLLLDKVVNDYGLNRIRLEIGAGDENNVDYFTQSLNGTLTPVTGHDASWTYVHCYRRNPVNDDADPNHINPNGFNFSALDWRIDNMVTPLRQILQTKGENLIINLNVVSFNVDSNCGSIPSYDTSFRQYNYADEYAEFMLAAFRHMQSKYGFVPNMIEIMLEPDLTLFNGTKMGNALKATQALLSTNGFNPKYVVPSVTNMANVLPYINAIKAVVGETFISQHVQEVSYHRYTGVSDTNLQAIASASVTYKVGASMLEWWNPGNTYQTLYKDLTMGRNTSWQQGTILGIYNVDVTNPANPVINTPDKTKFIRQYTKFIRPGAVRIDAQSTNSNLLPVAFINNGGKYAVVVNTSVGGSFSVDNLAPGTYGIKYTTVSQYDIDLPDQIITAGQNLSTNIPGAGVITVYSKTTVTPTTTSPNTPVPAAFCSSCSLGPSKSLGNANCDSKVDLSDFTLWLTVYRKVLSSQAVTETEKKSVDFNCTAGSTVHTVGLDDYAIWLSTYKLGLGD